MAQRRPRHGTWTQATRQALEQGAAWQQTMMEIWREAQRQWISLWTAGPRRGRRNQRTPRR